MIDLLLSIKQTSFSFRCNLEAGGNNYPWRK
jgi:hypothetical protein